MILLCVCICRDSQVFLSNVCDFPKVLPRIFFKDFHCFVDLAELLFFCLLAFFSAKNRIATLRNMASPEVLRF